MLKRRGIVTGHLPFGSDPGDLCWNAAFVRGMQAQSECTRHLHALHPVALLRPCPVHAMRAR